LHNAGGISNNKVIRRKRDDRRQLIWVQVGLWVMVYMCVCARARTHMHTHTHICIYIIVISGYIRE